MAADIDRGREAVKFFHNKSVGRGPYAETLDSLIQKLAPKQSAIFLEGLGSTILMLEMTTSQVKESMETLAIDAGGRIPSQTVFFQALGRRIQNFTFWEATKSVTADSAADLAKGAQSFGDSVIATLKSINVLFPIVIVAGLLYVSHKKIKNL